MREKLDLEMEAQSKAIQHLAEMIDLKLNSIQLGINALDEKLYTATRVQGEKVLTATASLDHRLEEMMTQIHNLEALTSLNSGIYLTKAEHFTWKAVVDNQLNTLHDFETIVRTKASASSLVISFVVSGIVFAISVIGFALTIADRVAGK